MEKEMSYARFGWDDSEVYVFMHVGGFLECSACLLAHEEGEPFDANDTQTMINHLKKHESAGYNVPRHIYALLWEDDKENFSAR